MQLSERLQAVADFVTPQSRLADVGTDHAYVPIYLAEKKIITRAIAMDVVDGPLQRARENIAAHRLEAVIETRKSDGLEALKPGEADTVVIAGMGGLLICRILEQGREVADTVREWVLEPQSDTDKVRQYLLDHAYTIRDEHMVLEDGKYYPILKAYTGKQEVEENSDETPYSAVELLYGRYLLRKKHPALRQYLEKEILTYRKLLKNLSGAPGERARAREQEVAKCLALAEQALQMAGGGSGGL